MLSVLVEAEPSLERHAPLARALLADAAPFRPVAQAASHEALTAESGLRARRGGLERAWVMVDEAWEAFAELEDERALELVTAAVPYLVPAHADPRGARLLARAHLLAGAIYLARGRIDAAASRLRRALDLAPDLVPPSNTRLIGALEAVRAAHRGEGALEIRLSGTATVAEVSIDGRPAGRAPGRLLVPTGRHLLRVSHPGQRSHVAPIEILDARATSVAVHLADDPLQLELARLGARLRAGLPLGPLQRRLARRAGADRTLVAALVLSEQRSGGSARPGLLIELEGAGRAFAPRLDRSAVREALQALAGCRATEDVRPVAPALALGTPAVRTEARPPSPLPLPALVFAGLALAGLGIAAGLAIGQGSSGPPDDVSIRLIPRP